MNEEAIEMDIDPNERYFVMSFRFNKNKAEDFGLTPSAEEGIYIDNKDGSLWIRRQLYSFGWGQENGFMRVPQLTFEQLWYLLINSDIEGNRYGAATIIEEEYAGELRDLILNVFSNDDKIKDSIKMALRILKLDTDSRNRSKTEGKSFDEVEKDYKLWQYISERAAEIIKKEVPKTPDNIGAFAINDNMIKIAWDSVANAKSYMIFRSMVSDSKFHYIGFSTTMSYKDTNLEGTTTYYYKVSAINDYGQSALQECPVSATTSS